MWNCRFYFLRFYSRGSVVLLASSRVLVSARTSIQFGIYSTRVLSHSLLLAQTSNENGNELFDSHAYSRNFHSVSFSIGGMGKAWARNPVSISVQLGNVSVIGLVGFEPQ